MAYKIVGQKWTHEPHFMFLGVQESVKEWTPRLPSEFPIRELDSQWTPKFLEGNFMSQNSLDWEAIYIIRKILECICLKWARMAHFGS
jgi:hypothetical protein